MNPSQRSIGITEKKVPSGGGAEGSCGHGERLLTVSAATRLRARARLQWILVPASPSERLITYRLDRALVIDRDAVHARSTDAPRSDGRALIRRRVSPAARAALILYFQITSEINRGRLLMRFKDSYLRK